MRGNNIMRIVFKFSNLTFDLFKPLAVIFGACILN